MSTRKFIIFDLEATCWEKGSWPDRMEIIEIGAVRVREDDWSCEDEFSRFVQPIGEPILSDFCMTLTGIRQEDVDEAKSFPEVLNEFLRWTGTGEQVWMSWGMYDRRQIEHDCRRHRIAVPQILESHMNLKAIFTEVTGVRRAGMKRALQVLGLPLEGSHHRGLDDARNIVAIGKKVWPEYQRDAE